MKGKFTKILLFLLPGCLLIPEVSGQDAVKKRDIYTLLTTPYNRRPLSLYRGELQFDAGYKFAVRTHTFNSAGDIVTITNMSLGSVYHYYLATLHYGVTDFLELGAESSIIRHGQRESSVEYVSASLTTTDRVTVNRMTEVKGMGDILFVAKLRLPVDYRWFDISATGGLFIPSSDYQPEKPSNSVTNVKSADSYTVNYRYNYSYGFGVPVYLLSGSIKGGYGKISAEGGFVFKTPVREGTNIRWDENMVNKVFYYEESDYKYLLSNSFFYNISLHYQATGWFDLYMSGSYQNTNGGWTEYYGRKYSNRETALLNIEPGFELQVSPSLKICQIAGFPVSGKNNDAPFYLMTTIRYTLFPFRR